MSKHKKITTTATHRRSAKLKQIHRLMRKEAGQTEIERVVADDPDAALTFAVDQLNDEQVDACVRRCPATGILFAWCRLSEPQRAYCVWRAPGMALRAVPHELTPEQIQKCAKRAPRAASEYPANYYITPEYSHNFD